MRVAQNGQDMSISEQVYPDGIECTFQGLGFTPAQHETLTSLLITWKYGIQEIPGDTYEED